MLLLKFNADVSVINAEGNTPKSLARNPEIKTVIEGQYCLPFGMFEDEIPVNIPACAPPFFWGYKKIRERLPFT